MVLMEFRSPMDCGRLPVSELLLMSLQKNTREMASFSEPFQRSSGIGSCAHMTLAWERGRRFLSGYRRRISRLLRCLSGRCPKPWRGDTRHRSSTSAPRANGRSLIEAKPRLVLEVGSFWKRFGKMDGLHYQAQGYRDQVSKGVGFRVLGF